jgi:hypothetical protein
VLLVAYRRVGVYCDDISEAPGLKKLSGPPRVPTVVLNTSRRGYSVT